MKYFFLIPALLCLSACATVDRGVLDYARVDSVPQGARVTLLREDDTKKMKPRVCEATPCAISVPRRSTLVAKIEKPGYQPAEVFMFPTTMQGGAAGSALANSSISAGSGAAVGAWAAAFGNGFTFGSNPLSQSAFASSGAALGLGVGVGMIAFDAAAGSNLNLYPNPVVIELAKNGEDTVSDPLIDLFKRHIESETTLKTYCGTLRTAQFPKKREAKCRELYDIYKSAADEFGAALDARKAAIKAAIKADREIMKNSEN